MSEEEPLEKGDFCPGEDAQRVKAVARFIVPVDFQDDGAVALFEIGDVHIHKKCGPDAKYARTRIHIRKVAYFVSRTVRLPRSFNAPFVMMGEMMSQIAARAMSE